MANTSKTYYPAKTFDDDLDGLVKLATEKKWSFSGVDGKQSVEDVKLQRHERSLHDTLESRYFNTHEAFGVAQHERYERFASLLNAARGAFPKDKAIMAELD